MIDPRLSPVLDRIDEAVLDPRAWAGALDAISDLVGGNGVAILSRAHGVGLWSRVAPELQAVFYSRFAGAGDEANPIQAGTDHLLRTVGAVPGVVTDRLLVDRDVFTRSDYYNDFMRRGDADSSMLVNLTLGESAGFLNVSRGPAGGEFSAGDIGVMSALQPRLARSFWLAMRLAGRPAAGPGLHGLLASTADALFVVDADGRVIHANAAAEAMVRAPGGFSIGRSKLLAPSVRLTERLHALIALAAARDGHGGVGELAAPTPERRRPLAVTVAPVRSESALDGFGARVALVFVTDLDAQTPLPERRLAELFDLTPAETRIALALFAGASPREAAAALDVSFFTVRAHLISIFRKTDTAGQAELARLLARVASVTIR